MSEGRQEARSCPAKDEGVHRGLVGISREDHHAASAGWPMLRWYGAAESVARRWPRIMPLHAGNNTREYTASAARNMIFGCERDAHRRGDKQACRLLRGPSGMILFWSAYTL